MIHVVDATILSPMKGKHAYVVGDRVTVNGGNFAGKYRISGAVTITGGYIDGGHITGGLAGVKDSQIKIEGGYVSGDAQLFGNITITGGRILGGRIEGTPHLLISGGEIQGGTIKGCGEFRDGFILTDGATLVGEIDPLLEQYKAKPPAPDEPDEPDTPDNPDEPDTDPGDDLPIDDELNVLDENPPDPPGGDQFPIEGYYKNGQTTCYSGPGVAELCSVDLNSMPEEEKLELLKEMDTRIGQTLMQERPNGWELRVRKVGVPLYDYKQLEVPEESDEEIEEAPEPDLTVDEKENLEIITFLKEDPENRVALRIAPTTRTEYYKANMFSPALQVGSPAAAVQSKYSMGATSKYALARRPFATYKMSLIYSPTCQYVTDRRIAKPKVTIWQLRDLSRRLRKLAGNSTNHILLDFAALEGATGQISPPKTTKNDWTRENDFARWLPEKDVNLSVTYPTIVDRQITEATEEMDVKIKEAFVAFQRSPKFPVVRGISLWLSTENQPYYKAAHSLPLLVRTARGY
jgi:hypothetical protein